jgi:hypothetical protein
MTDSKPTESFSKGEFNGVFIRNESRITPRKSIVICGITPGSTFFAASVFGNLGVPFTRPGEAELGRRYEHRALRRAFQERDGTAIREVAEDFSAQHPVWAWKLPSIQRGFDFVAEHVPNPHFVIIFKEPLSIAYRKSELKGKGTVHYFVQVLAIYQRLLEFAGRTEHPLLLMSYDRGLSKLEKFLPEIAEFAGATEFDVPRAIEGIRKDGKRYFRPEDEEEDGEEEQIEMPMVEKKVPNAKKAEKRAARAEKKVVKVKQERKAPASFL